MKSPVLGVCHCNHKFGETTKFYILMWSFNVAFGAIFFKVLMLISIWCYLLSKHPEDCKKKLWASQKTWTLIMKKKSKVLRLEWLQMSQGATWLIVWSIGRIKVWCTSLPLMCNDALSTRYFVSCISIMNSGENQFLWEWK